MELLAPPDVMSVRATFEYLLLGDLRALLEEAPSPQTSRWLLATLDLLLATRPRAVDSPYLMAVSRTAIWEGSPDLVWQERGSLFAKLQRLRDRIAHQSPYILLANEIRCDLRDLMDT